MITYRIDPDEGVIWTTMSGVLTDEELLQHQRNLIQDPDFRPNLRELADVRHLDDFQLTSEGVERLVSQDRAHLEQIKDHKLAIVVSQDLVYGMARMYQMLTQQYIPNVAVFRDMDEAREWLSL